MNTPIQGIYQYYALKESRWGYKLIMHDSKHLGWYPKNTKITEWKAQQNYQDKVAQVLQLKSNQRVLDAGCGRGVTACYLAKKFGVFVTGVDLLNFELEIAIEKAKRKNLEDQVDFKLMDYSKLAMPDGTFDAIYANETLSHAPDLEKVLKEFFRVLKPGGRLALFEYVLAKDSKFSSEEINTLDFVINQSAMVGLKQFRFGDISQLLKKVGFTKVEEENVTDNVLPSFRRLRNIALFFYPFIKLFKLEKKFINTFSAFTLYPMVKKGLINFAIFTAEKL